MLKLLLFVLPLGLDTFAVSAALALGGLPRRDRTRVSLLLTAFEAAMPVVGLLLGRALGDAIGGAAEWVAVAALAVLGGWMLLHEEEGEGAKAAALARRSGFAVVALGLSISLDELAIGFTIGLLDLSLWLAVALIGAQAFLCSQLGLRLGARLEETYRERAEQLAGLALLGLAVLLVVEQVA